MELRLAPADYDLAALRLDDVLGEDRCPVCTLLSSSTKNYIDALLNEHVTDVITRARVGVRVGLLRSPRAASV